MRYLSCLQIELELLSHSHPVDTIFIGGGTPTHLQPSELKKLCQLVCRWFVLQPGGEFSVEANPSDITAEKVEILAAAGVNRISLGAQSFQREKLQRLERDHDAQTVFRAVEVAKKHIPNISLDLIFAAPTETNDRWRDDLSKAISLKPRHISTYGLTIEKGTSFYSRVEKQTLATVDEATQEAMYLSAIDQLTAAGYEHYEVSNFAKKGARCRHNESYWLGDSWFAAGPGAARYVNGVRETNHRSTFTWMKRLEAGKSPVDLREELDPESATREKLVFGLRRLQGVNSREFELATGYSITSLAGSAIASMVQNGLLQWNENTLQLTQRGLLVSDGIWPHLL